MILFAIFCQIFDKKLNKYIIITIIYVYNNVFWLKWCFLGFLALVLRNWEGRRVKRQNSRAPPETDNMEDYPNIILLKYIFYYAKLLYIFLYKGQKQKYFVKLTGSAFIFRKDLFCWFKIRIHNIWLITNKW